jgi:hypothetical protein
MRSRRSEREIFHLEFAVGEGQTTHIFDGEHAGYLEQFSRRARICSEEFTNAAEFRTERKSTALRHRVLEKSDHFSTRFTPGLRPSVLGPLADGLKAIPFKADSSSFKRPH